MKLRLTELATELDGLDAESLDVDDWLSVLGEHGIRLVRVRAAINAVSDSFGLGSAQSRILQYLLSRVGEVTPGSTLAGVAGIGEWARRIRELRVEHGWPIDSGLTRDDMNVDDYMLAAAAPDPELARRWRIAKETRGLAGSGQDRALRYLQIIFPNAADQQQMAYVSRIQSWQRRVRELEEYGWDVRSNVDDPTLLPGSYRLGSLKKGRPRPRKAIKLRYDVLERDGRTCKDCGADPIRDHVRLQVHHILPIHLGGGDKMSNLLTLCEACHSGRHATMKGQRVKDELREPEEEPDLLS